MSSAVVESMNERRLGDFESLCESLALGTETVSARYHDCRLSSAFQPIFSLSHQRVVGYEGLMRGHCAAGQPISPLELLAGCRDFSETLVLDRLSRLVHLSNFSRQAPGTEWLFLNMHPEAFLRAGRDDCVPVFQRMLALADLRPQQIVIEVLENVVRADIDFAPAVDFFRQLGCLIAVDDFGSGHSNFDRIWQIQPEIVKLDRGLIVRAAGSRKVRRMLAQMVSLLHECSALVLMEGIETAEEARIALDSDVDFTQGYYFGRPQSRLVTGDSVAPGVQALWQVFDESWQSERQDYLIKVAPYSNALGNASVLLSAGHSLADACAAFLELPGADQCYLLDSHAQQIGQNLHSGQHDHASDERFAPLANAQGARWARRPYFKRAIDHFGRVQITRPYLSISSARLCVTLSASLRREGAIYVLCGDVLLNEE